MKSPLLLVPMVAVTVLGMSTSLPVASAGPTVKTISFVSTSASGWEGGAALVTLTRSDNSRDTSFVLSTAAGTAVPGVDFTDISGKYTFPANQQGMAVAVPLLNDSVADDNETFTVTIARAAGGFKVGTPSTATVTIVGPPPTQVQNGGFESGSLAPYWPIRRVGPPAPAIVSAAHAGSYGVQLGGAYTGAANDSQIAQTISVAATGTTTVSWYSKLDCTDSETPGQTGDWAQVLVYSVVNGAETTPLAVLGGPWCTTESRWTLHSEVIPSSYNGSVVNLVIGVRQDGSDPSTLMYVDDVTISHRA